VTPWTVGTVALAVAVGLGCSEDPGNVSEVVAQNSSLPDGIDATRMPVGALVNEASELAPTWTQFGFPDELTISYPDDGVLLFVGTVESGTCPAVIERVSDPPDSIDADLMITIDHRGADACTSDARPVSFVLALPDEPIRRVYVGYSDNSALGGYVRLET
jgi:hypothetical protein